MTTPAEAWRAEWARLRQDAGRSTPRAVHPGYIVELKKSDLKGLLYEIADTPEVFFAVVLNHHNHNNGPTPSQTGGGFDAAYYGLSGGCWITRIIPWGTPYVVLDPPPPKPALQVQPAPAKLDTPKPQRDEPQRGYGYEPTQW